MFRIVVYEFTVSGGLDRGGLSAETAGSLSVEGRAMVQALTADLAAIPERCVELLVDESMVSRGDLPAPATIVRVPAGQERAVLQQQAARADATLVIAPETDGILAERWHWVREAGGTWFGQPMEVIELTSDKHRTCEHLHRHGVPAPRGWRLDAGSSWPSDCSIPAVLKPCDGAGSEGVRVVERPIGSDGWQKFSPSSSGARAWRLEPLLTGDPVSVSLLCGPRGKIALAPCRQILSRDGRFHYLGGSLPLPAEHAARATRLALAAVGTLRDPLGFLGVDLILGADPEGRDDAVIEINPRLTTSYVGLRAACRENLASAMLDVARGGTPQLSFDDRPLHFTADGTLHKEALQ